MKNELIVGMLADIFKQPDWIIDWRLVEPENDIVRLQSGRRCGRVRLHFVNDRCLRRKDEQLTYTLSPPSARLGLVRFYPDCAHGTIALEFHGNLVAFTSHHIPAHAVIHPKKTPDWFAVHFEDFIAWLKSNLLRW